MNNMKNLKYMVMLIALLFVAGCSDYLDLKPTDKVTADDVFASQAGIDAFLANLYYNMPIEDFNYNVRGGFNFNSDNPNNAGTFECCTTDDAANSIRINLVDYAFDWWVGGYNYNKDVNLFFSVIPTITSIDEATRRILYGEAWFMRAYTYFELAKRYGGVPIITSISDASDTEALNVPRSTEKATWEFAVACCDSAAYYLGSDISQKRRASKWSALALKSRIALSAASIAKYWNEAPLSGQAADAKLVGMTPGDAQYFYDQCIDASAQIIDAGVYSLYKPTPANVTEATENYRSMFEDPNRGLEEMILIKGYARVGTGYGHNFDIWANPAQTAGSWPHPGRFNPTLDLVDEYESYTNEGHAAPVRTISDENEDFTDFSGYNPAKNYLTFDNPTDIFKDKDARLHATVIIPFSMWRNTQIIIQGGYIQPDGTLVLRGANEPIEVGGDTYYVYGASGPTLYSGFDTYGNNMTVTGFGFRKFLNTNYVPSVGWNQSTTDFIAFRYAEVLLNYAEAVVESGSTIHQAKAAKAINDIRKRAAFKTDIPLTLENVLRERRVELVFEGNRYWDLIRRRMYHKKFDNSNKTALTPILDLRSMKYIFVRENTPYTTPATFTPRQYYKIIPGVAANGLIQNPQY
jgi:hypothetical protein